jgi:hypothetical protein
MTRMRVSKSKEEIGTKTPKNIVSQDRRKINWPVYTADIAGVAGIGYFAEIAESVGITADVTVRSTRGGLIYQSCYKVE